MADTITKNQIIKDVNDILKGADLTQLSSKKIRKQLEEKYDVNLSERKKEIDNIVLEGMEAIENDQANSEIEEKKSSVDNDDGDADEESGDSSGSDLEAPEDMGPPVKKQKTKKKESASEDESDEKPKDDATIARQLQEEENFQGRRTRGGRKTPSKKAPKTSTKSNGPKKASGTYAKEFILSPALAAVMGADKMKRGDVVKKMWELVKERELQDPKNKSFMICDDELYKVFGRKRVKTFGMMKYLTDHIFTPEEYSNYFGVDPH